MMMFLSLSVSLFPPAVNPCCYFPCQNQGVCVRVGLRGYECDCTRTGYYGVNCTSRKCLSLGSGTRGCQGSTVPTALTDSRCGWPGSSRG